MANMANIIVKNASGNDVTLTALTPSSGDRTSAQWRANSIGTLPINHPTLSCLTQFNGPKNARRITINFTYPIMDPILVGNVLARVPFKVEAVLPLNAPVSETDDAMVIAGNLIASDLVKEILKTGYNAQ